MKMAARTSKTTKLSLAGLTLATGTQDANSSLSLRASGSKRRVSFAAIFAAISEGDTARIQIRYTPPIA